MIERRSRLLFLRLTKNPIIKATSISIFTGSTELGNWIKRFAITRAKTAITIQTRKKDNEKEEISYTGDDDVFTDLRHRSGLVAH